MKIMSNQTVTVTLNKTVEKQFSTVIMSDNCIKILEKVPTVQTQWRGPVHFLLAENGSNKKDWLAVSEHLSECPHP